MLAPEENLSVMRVQEGLRRLGFDPGKLDGFFGDLTGGAVHEFKATHGLSPDDPVVGPGTSAKLEELLLHEPPELDPDFGEVAGFVTANVVEPFVGLELAPLLLAPLNSQRRDIGFALLAALRSGQCLGVVAASRASGLTDARIPADVRPDLDSVGLASGFVLRFVGTDGANHLIMVLGDRTIRGLHRLIHRPSGLTTPVDLRSVVCHEVTHIRNDSDALDATPDSDANTFLDPALAAASSAASGTPTGVVFRLFATEMNARHVAWIVEQEIAGDPFAARFLPPAEFVEAAHFYFAETDREFFFSDNGYLGAILAQGHQATFQQLALWLRRTADMTFSDNAEAQEISSRLFRDAADSADQTALDPNAARPDGNGLFPRKQDFR